MTDHLLEVENLFVEFSTRDGIVKAVNGMNFTLNEGETIAILGESGSGKSVTAQAIMGILDMKIASIPKGSIRYKGQELVDLSEKDHRKLRGSDLSMIFQDALSALNPVTCVGDQVAEMYRVHQGASKKQAKAQAIEVMGHVGIPAAAKRYRGLPAPVQRRHAAAHHDRDDDRPAAEGAHRRRAHHRARRHGPGTDHGAAPGPAA